MSFLYQCYSIYRESCYQQYRYICVSLFIEKVVISSTVLFVINHKFSKPFFKDIINHTLPHVNSRLPAKVIGDFSTLEREKAILSQKHKITIRQEEFNERRSVKCFVASLCPKRSVLQPSIIFIDHQLLFSICYTHFKSLSPLD